MSDITNANSGPGINAPLSPVRNPIPTRDAPIMSGEEIISMSLTSSHLKSKRINLFIIILLTYCYLVSKYLGNNGRGS